MGLEDVLREIVIIYVRSVHLKTKLGQEEGKKCRSCTARKCDVILFVCTSLHKYKHLDFDVVIHGMGLRINFL